MGEEQREAVMNILTEEQQETLKEMRGQRGQFFDRRGWGGKDRHDMRRGGKGRHDARRGGQGAFSRLDLTDEAEGTVQGIAPGAPHRNTRNATKAPHGFGKRLDRGAARKARGDEGRSVLRRRQTLARQAVSTDSCFPSRRGVAWLLRVFFMLRQGQPRRLQEWNLSSHALVQRPVSDLSEYRFFKYLLPYATDT